MKKFVVTGGSGFIGSNLVKFLLNKNYFVINIDKLSYSANPYNLKEISRNKNYIFFKQDINNKNEILKILNRFKPIGIFNLAAETHVDRSIDDPKNFIKSNILGVYNLLAAVNKYSKKKKISSKKFAAAALCSSLSLTKFISISSPAGGPGLCTEKLISSAP